MKFIICGAGLIGLLTAQALKSRGIQFVIIDRDESSTCREHLGWAITLHWALNTFKDLLPSHLVDKIYEAEVRPNFHLADTGNFKYINAATGETIFSIPPSSRLRVRREQIRKILLSDLDVEWGCRLSDIKVEGEKVKALCENGKIFEGDIFLGCDGANSKARRIVCPLNGESYQLPIRFCGAKIKLTKTEVDHISNTFDPLLFQGTIPKNNTFFWFSMLSVPDKNQLQDSYFAQVNLSWNKPENERFVMPDDIATAMITHGEGLHDDLQALLQKVVSKPEEIQEIKLCDWPICEWDTKDSRVILLGDSAHAMTMYRGEAANHGITDVYDFCQNLDEFMKGQKSWAACCSSTCQAIKERASRAVLLSRKACLDAHDFSSINMDSPLVAVRKRI